MYEKIKLTFFIIIISSFVLANKSRSNSAQLSFYNKEDVTIKGKKNYYHIKTNKFEGAPILPKLNFSDIVLPKEYIVQSGDTLFSICKKFVNDGRMWPKLWAMNINIINNL